MRRIDELTFDNSYARLPEGFFQRVAPTPFENAWLVHLNPAAANLIGLDPREAERADFADFITGRKTIPGSDPIAMLYAGHQFSHYVPQLGDGRAILLGEVTSSVKGLYNGHLQLSTDKWDLQVKGAGKTAFSRFGDGRAVLRSSIREYLGSEAMHGLGIPTTRALCLIGSDEPVFREAPEPGAMLVRMAPSHVRFGSFEVFYYREQTENLRSLADYVIGQFYPQFAGVAPQEKYYRWFKEVIRRTGQLMAEWQAVGFCHGVMNTDNFSILGLTMDYGPYGFMDDFDPGHICNHTDQTGLYAFQNQPGVGFFNLQCLAQALSPLMTMDQVNTALGDYEPALATHFLDLMGAKHGFKHQQAMDEEIFRNTFELLKGTDFTRFFRALDSFSTADGADNSALGDLVVDRPAWAAWAPRYRARLRAESSDDAERKDRMDRINPKFILRNYLAQQAIDAAHQRDYSEIDSLLKVLRNPFAEHPESERYAAPPPDWGRKLEVSCSS
jgi:uncharacterized protein YdiU (UPF0061 family)